MSTLHVVACDEQFRSVPAEDFVYEGLPDMTTSAVLRATKLAALAAGFLGIVLGGASAGASASAVVGVPSTSAQYQSVAAPDYVVHFTYPDGFTPRKIRVPFNDTYLIRSHSDKCGPGELDDCVLDPPFDEAIEVPAGAGFKSHAVVSGTSEYRLGANYNTADRLLVRKEMKLVKAGTRGWKLRWSTPGMRTNYGGVDLQVRRPGSTRWTSLAKHTSAARTYLKPTRTGTHRFRVRAYWNFAIPREVSGWSPVSRIVVR